MRRFLGVSLTLIAMLWSSFASAQGLVERAEATDLLRSHGTSASRVERNEQGHVTRLLLNEMQLTPADFEEIVELKHLQSLVLFRTNVTDDDLADLPRCGQLMHLNLTGTEVTDRSIETILQLKNLRSLCLGNVRITPNAMEKLKERNRTSDQWLYWGYSQRRE